MDVCVGYQERASLKISQRHYFGQHFQSDFPFSFFGAKGN
jgi:hypothetical protein